MDDIEALSAAIFAINTFTNPDASSYEDIEWLDQNATKVIEHLAAMREKAVLAALPSTPPQIEEYLNEPNRG